MRKYNRDDFFEIESLSLITWNSSEFLPLLGSYKGEGAESALITASLQGFTQRIIFQFLTLLISVFYLK